MLLNYFLTNSECISYLVDKINFFASSDNLLMPLSSERKFNNLYCHVLTLCDSV